MAAGSDGTSDRSAAAVVRHTAPPRVPILVPVERRRNPPPVPEHEHPEPRLPRSLQALVLISFVGLLASVVLVFIQARETNARLDRLEQYVAGRGHVRDAERDAQEQQFNKFVCTLLDQLPVAPTLDRLRDQYGCGPGLDPAAVPTP